MVKDARSPVLKAPARQQDEQMVDPRGRYTKSSETSGHFVVVYDLLYFPSQ